MSQNIFSSIDPSISGTTLATTLNDFKDAVVSGCSGTSRPTNLQAGGAWIDTTNDPTYWSYKVYTGAVDIEVFRLYLSTSLASVALAVDDFSIKRVSADTTGAILELIKRRVATNGQVLSGDTIGTIKFTGRTSTSTNPTVAYVTVTATDDQTTSAYGVTVSFYSTPDGTATATEHLRFINGTVETVLPLKLNSLRLVGQNVATAATISSLNADKVLVELTGATATDIQGIASTGSSQVVSIHNRSSAVVTLKHQNTSATAAERLQLPNSTDYTLNVDSTATLYYCTADTRWKLLSVAEKNFTGSLVTIYYGASSTFTAPSGVSQVRVRSYRRLSGIEREIGALTDVFGNSYAWGLNTNGNLGVGDVVPRSSPVAVLGSLQFSRIFGNNAGVSNYGIHSTSGNLYAWGGNASGQLGTNDVVPRSSPVAVVGSLKWQSVFPRDASMIGLTTSNAAYSCGINTHGQLGVGDVVPRSSPVAVLGSLRFANLLPISGAAGATAVCALTTTGTPYSWGINTNGNLGLGDITSRSSPVAVLGGFTFSEIGGGASSTRYFFNALNSSGAAYSWGNNASGQLGVGDTTPRSSPVAVVGGLSFARLITHPKSESVLGLTSAGALYGWGDNAQGTLGVGDTTNRSSPVAVLGGLTFSKVRLFRQAAFGLTADGTLYAWGINTAGVLGIGDVVSRSSPVAVLGSLKFVDIVGIDGSTDNYSVLAIQADGTLYAWGANTNGTLGLGDVAARSSPIAVLGGFRADASEATYSVDLTVTPGSSYTVTINTGIATFGATPIGFGAYKVEVEYLQ
jgi:alpha-tubulin suppressor-like RCC1 family protein